MLLLLCVLVHHMYKHLLLLQWIYLLVAQVSSGCGRKRLTEGLNKQPQVSSASTLLPICPTWYSAGSEAAATGERTQPLAAPRTGSIYSSSSKHADVHGCRSHFSKHAKHHHVTRDTQEEQEQQEEKIKSTHTHFDTRGKNVRRLGLYVALSLTWNTHRNQLNTCVTCYIQVRKKTVTCKCNEKHQT